MRKRAIWKEGCVNINNNNEIREYVEMEWKEWYYIQLCCLLSEKMNEPFQWTQIIPFLNIMKISGK